MASQPFSCAQVDHTSEPISQLDTTFVEVTTGKASFCYLHFLGTGLHLRFSALQGNIAAGECLPLFERNSGSPAAFVEKEAVTCQYSKGEFQFLSVSNKGVGVALYRTDNIHRQEQNQTHMASMRTSEDFEQNRTNQL